MIIVIISVDIKMFPVVFPTCSRTKKQKQNISTILSAQMSNTGPHRAYVVLMLTLFVYLTVCLFFVVQVVQFILMQQYITHVDNRDYPENTNFENH